MTCELCNKEITRWGIFSFPHRCLRQSVVKAMAARQIGSMKNEGPGTSWAPTIYGNYYSQSTLVYAAIRIRQDAILRPRLKVLRKVGDEWEEVEDPNHPLKSILSRVNSWWTVGDLWRGTSTFLDLWGSCFWVVKNRDPKNGLPMDIWLRRPDMMKVIPDANEYISAYIFEHQRTKEVWDPKDVTWIRLFNPLEEFAGMSPMAPLRLSVDTANDAVKHNRSVFTGGILTDTIIQLEGAPLDEELEEFDNRVAARFGGVGKSHKPLILSGVQDIKNLGLSAREMEFIGSLRWSLEDTSRVFGVPKPLLSDLERATYANIQHAERIFWRNTIAPYLVFLQEEINEMFVPQFSETLSEELRVEFDLTDIEALQKDQAEVDTSNREDIKLGILTINEVREERGLDGVPWGDAYWVAAGMIPVEEIPEEEAPEPAPDDDTEEGAPIPADQVSSYKKYKRYSTPSEEMLTAAYEGHGKRLDRFSERFKGMQQSLFRAQERDILKSLNNSDIRRAIGEEIEIVPPPPALSEEAAQTLFDPSEWVNDFSRRGRPLIVRSLRESAQAQSTLFSLGVSFDINHPVVQEWIDTRTEFWSSRVNGETARLVTQEVEAARVAGEGIDDISTRMRKVFSLSEHVRSDRIARTEIQSSTNRGAVEVYRQSGVVELKQWIATRDERTREPHSIADGQQVELSASFLVDGEVLEHPGATGGSASNVVHCRCTTAPIVRRPERSWAKFPRTHKPHEIIASTNGKH